MGKPNDSGERPIDALRRRQPVRGAPGTAVPQAGAAEPKPPGSGMTPEERRAALAAKAAGMAAARQDREGSGLAQSGSSPVRNAGNAESAAAKRTRSHKVVSTDAVEREVRRMDHKGRTRSALTTTLVALLAVAAAAIVLAVYFLPVFNMNGESMLPTFQTGDVVVGLRTKHFERGDLMAFYYNNQVLVKRVIGVGGDVVSIAPNGTVSVNGEALDEPYVYDLDYGQCDIEFPYTVPAGKYFILGDHRSVSVDSRASAIGCVSESQLGGKLLFRVLPFDGFGPVS